MDEFDEAAKKLEEVERTLEAGLPDPVLLEAGHLGLTLVLARTKQGVDVDGKPFEKYSDDYAKQRAKRGLSEMPDLAVSGHMLGAAQPMITGKNEVTVGFVNEREAIKDAAHNEGVDKLVSVRSHRRSVYVDSKTGRRVTVDEARRDKRRKNKRVAQRTEQVGVFQRQQRTKKREHMDIRQQNELEMIGDVLGNGLAATIERKL